MPLVEGSRPGSCGGRQPLLHGGLLQGWQDTGRASSCASMDATRRWASAASGVRRRAVTRAGARVRHHAAGAARAGAACTAWRCIEIELDEPTESGSKALRLWSNPSATVEAPTIAALYRKRWRIEGMFGRLESVLHSEIKTLGHPRAALLGFYGGGAGLQRPGAAAGGGRAGAPAGHA